MINIASRVIDIEIEALVNLRSNLGKSFELCVDKILELDSRVVMCGMGKSGIIAKKIAASLASTGTSSFFMHPGEAYHGDLGMVKNGDVFIAISNSGETDELLKLLPFLQDNGNFIIAMTGNISSTLAKNADCVLNISVPKEACPHQLAPTSSTTATLVLGDALTVALMELRQFTPENFARFHPGGSLGRKLLSKVQDEMVAMPIPSLSPSAQFTEIVSAISEGRLGFAIINNTDTKEFSVITDGDLRRAMQHFRESVFSIQAHEIASGMPHTVSKAASMEHAFELMEKHKISFLLVLEGEELVGVLKK